MTLSPLVTRTKVTLDSMCALQYTKTVFGSVLTEWLMSQPDFVSKYLTVMNSRFGPEVVYRSTFEY